MSYGLLPEDGFHHPLFISPVPYLYQITYRTSRKFDQVIYYTSPHEVILNLYCFRDDDKVMYRDKTTEEELFTIPVDRFKLVIAESLLSATQDKLELLYMRLVLTNRYSKSIPDRGRFRQYDYTLKKYLLTIRGGYDCYLSAERGRTIFYIKVRRLSCLHLLAVIDHWNQQNDIYLNHINLPTTMTKENRGLVYECLRVMLSEKGFRLYSYTPVEEDNIVQTDISKEIIQVINQLIR